MQRSPSQALYSLYYTPHAVTSTAPPHSAVPSIHTRAHRDPWCHYVSAMRFPYTRYHSHSQQPVTGFDCDAWLLCTSRTSHTHTHTYRTWHEPAATTMNLGQCRLQSLSIMYVIGTSLCMDDSSIHVTLLSERDDDSNDFDAG